MNSTTRGFWVLVAFGVAFGCEPPLSVTPEQLDGFHLMCKQRMADGYKVQGSRNVGFGARKPAGTPVVIYGANWCEPCHVAAAYLERRGIPFVQFDVDRDEPARAAMDSRLEAASLYADGTLPIIDVRGTVMKGFNPCAVESAWAG